jgi:hypothetical protein
MRFPLERGGWVWVWCPGDGAAGEFGGGRWAGDAGPYHVDTVVGGPVGNAGQVLLALVRDANASAAPTAALYFAMPKITLLLGAVLILLGLGAYGYALTSEHASVTALIPAFFGVPILVFGLGASRWSNRQAIFMHVVALLALLGLVGSARGLVSLPSLLTRPEEVARPAAVIVQSVMALFCLAYLVLAVRSFVAARRSDGNSGG